MTGDLKIRTQWARIVVFCEYFICNRDFVAGATYEFVRLLLLKALEWLRESCFEWTTEMYQCSKS